VEGAGCTGALVKDHLGVEMNAYLEHLTNPIHRKLAFFSESAFYFALTCQQAHKIEVNVFTQTLRV
jgi:hypothetical protein